MARTCLERAVETVETPYGPIRVKVARRDGRILNAAPEFDDCVAAAADARRLGQRRPGGSHRRAALNTTQHRRFNRLESSSSTARALRNWDLRRCAVKLIGCPGSISRRRSTTSTAGRTWGPPTKRSRPTPSPGTSGCSGIETQFVMGNDEHSQNVYPPRPGARAGSAGVLRPDGARNSAPCGRCSTFRYDDFIRTTEPPPQRRRAGAGDGALRRDGDVYEGFYEGWYCVGCEAFKQEKDLVDGKCPLHSTVELDQGEEPLLPPVGVPRPAARALPRTSRSSSSPRCAATRSCGCSRRAWTTSRSAARGSPGAFRCRTIPASVIYVWFDALINYASAVGFGPTRRCSNAGGRRICMSSARTSPGSTP